MSVKCREVSHRIALIRAEQLEQFQSGTGRRLRTVFKTMMGNVLTLTPPLVGISPVKAVLQ